jgi:hypothetical protein|tara:strand:- start:102 stop:374 length:273 start_codon:yes stop_codon:yes gene_type:complete
MSVESIGKQLEEYESDRDSAYAEMFSTQGWKYLMEYLTQQATRADSIENIDSMEELHLNRGKLKIIALLLNLEATTEHNRENEGSKLEWS